MKWIGQHVWSFISRFRSDVYLEDISTGTIANGGNLGLDASNKVVKATTTSLGTLTALQVDNIGINGDTITASGDLAIVATGNDITVDADTFTMSSAGVLLPVMTLQNTNDGNKPPSLVLSKVRASTTALDDDFIGEVSMQSENDAGELFTYAYTRAQIEDASDGVEEGKYSIGVKAHSNILANGLVVTGNGSGIADVALGSGTASITTIAGTLTMGSTAAMTNAGLVAVANQSNITGLGTISSGVWQGTAIATDQQKHLANFELEGFSVGDGTNYMIQEIYGDTKAPFEHQTSTGSDGLTATGPVRLLKSGGHVMPYAGTLKLWKGWATSSGTGQTVDVGLYKVTLVNNDADDVSPVVLKNTSFTSVGNSKALTFAETSFSVAFAAGDILISAIRNGTNAKRCDFASTFVVEWD